MPKKLEISIGPHRDQVEIAHVNDSSRPTVIDTELFVGRVLVKIRDFDGITPDGSPPIRTHEYFEKRNRRFDIQIEGRFKARPGVEPYRGDEIQFGSDFDKLVSFPMTPFKLGLSVARTIDPNTFYEFEPPSKRPYIMSPYIACMNTFSAWPSADHYKDALVSLQRPAPVTSNGQRPARLRSESVQDLVPVEASRQKKKYWHYIGLRKDPKIRDLAARNANLFAEEDAESSSPNGTVPKRPMPVHQLSFGARNERDEQQEQSNREKHASVLKKADKGDKPSGRFASLASKFSAMSFGNGSNSANSSSEPSPVSPLSSEDDDDHPVNGLNGTVAKLNNGAPELKGLVPGELAWAETLNLPKVNMEDPIEAQIGPWRFANPAVEPMEDNTFVFLDRNLPVAKRRKYFSKSEHLRQFNYDSDIVYGASFFSPFMDFNTFDLAIGPVHMNIAKYFTDMPVRYTLRSSRLVPGTNEEEVFVTIAFRLVDV